MCYAMDCLRCALRCYRGGGVSMRSCLRLGSIDAQLFALGALGSTLCNLPESLQAAPFAAGPGGIN